MMLLGLINQIEIKNLLLTVLIIILSWVLILFILWFYYKKKDRLLNLKNNQSFSPLRLVENYEGMAFSCEINESWTMNYVSSNAYKIIGYNNDDILRTGKYFFNEIIHPKYRKAVENAYQDAINQHSKLQIEYKIYTKNQEEKWVREESHIIYDSLGQAKSIEGYIYSIDREKDIQYAYNLSELKYRSLIDGIDFPLVVTKNVTELIDLNPAALYLFKANSKEDCLHRSPLEFIDPDYHEVYKTRMERLKDTKIPNLPVNYRLKRLDGTYISASLNAKPFFIEGGLYTYTLILESEDKQSFARQLKETERRTRDLVLYMHEGIAVFQVLPEDNDGKLIFANKMFSELLFDEYKNLVYKKFSQILGDYLQTDRQIIFNQLRKEKLREEIYDEKKNKYFEITLYFNKESELIVQIRDLTKEKQLIKKYHEEKEKLTKLLATTETTIWQWDVLLDKISFDKEIIKLMGYPSDYISRLGQADVKTLIHPEDTIQFSKIINEYFDNPSPYFSIEARIRIYSGEYRWWMIRGYAFEYDKNGRPTLIIGTHQDITHHKEKDQEIKFLSHHDHLTKLYNLRAYQEKIKEIDIEKNWPISLAIVDVDGLKVFNDAFNHSVGDDLLIKTAKLLSIKAKENDILARVGGDEFVMVMPKTPLKEAQKRFDTIKKQFASQYVMNIPISISFGVEEKFNSRFSLTQIKDMADSKMYQQKFSQVDSRLNILEKIQENFFIQYPFERKIVSTVHELSMKMADILKLNFEEKRILNIASQYYNIGIFSIKNNIFNNERQFEKSAEIEYRKHVENGYRIMLATYRDEFTGIAVLHHHEKYNGKGYPAGLKGKEIPCASRVISILATYARRINLAYPKEEVIAYIQSERKISYDPDILDAFIKLIL